MKDTEPDKTCVNTLMWDYLLKVRTCDSSHIGVPLYISLCAHPVTACATLNPNHYCTFISFRHLHSFIFNFYIRMIFRQVVTVIMMWLDMRCYFC